jgi:hypothetical protein
VNRKKGPSAGLKALIVLSGLCLFSNGGCLPDNFYADLVGGLLNLGAELVVTDAVTNALTPAENL